MTNRNKIQLSIIYTPFHRESGIFTRFLSDVGLAIRAVFSRTGQDRKTGRILRSLSNHHLQDIGMTRADIDARYPSVYSDRAVWPPR